MPLITKKNARFRGNWAYAVPQEQRRAPAPSRKIQLARLAALEGRLAPNGAHDAPTMERGERRAALR